MSTNAQNFYIFHVVWVIWIYIYCLFFPLHVQETTDSSVIKGLTPKCWKLDLASSLISLEWLLFTLKGKCLPAFLRMWLSSFPGSICWKDRVSYTCVLSFHHGDQEFPLGFLLHTSDLHRCWSLCYCGFVHLLLCLWNKLKFESIRSLSLFFLLNFLLGGEDHLYSCTYAQFLITVYSLFWIYSS